MASVRFRRESKPLIAGRLNTKVLFRPNEETSVDIELNSREMDVWIRLTETEINFLLDKIEEEHALYRRATQEDDPQSIPERR